MFELLSDLSQPGSRVVQPVQKRLFTEGQLCARGRAKGRRVYGTTEQGAAVDLSSAVFGAFSLLLSLSASAGCGQGDG